MVTTDPTAPPVEAGRQKKHVPGKNTSNKSKSMWNSGENGVRQTQEAWKNSTPYKNRPNVREGISKDGRTIRIHFGKKGIHGFPVFEADNQI